MRNRVLLAIITVIMAVSVFAAPAASFAGTAKTVDKVKNLQIKSVSKGIILTWEKSKNATHYIVYKARKGEKYKRLIVTSSTKITNRNILYKKRYYYKVRACVKKNGKIVRKSLSSEVVSAVSKSRVHYYNQKTAESVIRKARSKLGYSYVSGGKGPNAFDCSGFVYWVLNNTKDCPVKATTGSCTGLYRYNLKKYSIGTNKKYMKRGDILLFSYDGKTDNMCHAAFYYGVYNGRPSVIHASDRKTGVCIHPLEWQQKIAAIIRLP